LVRQPACWNRAVTVLLGLLLLVRVPWGAGGLLENLSQNLGAGADTNIWDTAAGGNVLGFLSAAALSSLPFVLIAWGFVPLGQVGWRPDSMRSFESRGVRLDRVVPLDRSSETAKAGER
jgi:hypothetical protein